MIYQDDYERPASDTASLATRMSSANAVYRAMGWGSYDSGGALLPGSTLAVNQTGQTEEVLTPAERGAWVAMVKQMLAENTTSGGRQQLVNINMAWNGTQMPSQETLAEINRQLALTLSGGT